MKRKLLFLVLGLLIAAPCYAKAPHTMMMMDKSWGGGNSQVVYSNTVTGLRVSASSNADPEVASGGAFVDALPQAILDLIAANPAGTLQFDAYSSTGLLLRGVLSAAGSGETNNGPLNVSNCANLDYSTFDGISSSGFHAIYGGSALKAGGTADEIAFVENALFKTNYTISGNTGQLANSVFRSNLSGSLWGSFFATTAGANVIYANPLYAGTGVLQFYSTAAAEYTVSSLAVGQVLTPSASGATIVSAKAGATYNWGVNQWVAASYNAASHTVIVRKLR